MVAAELVDVRHGRVDEDPADARLHRVAGHPLQPLRGRGLDHDRDRPLPFRRVDGLEELLDLDDGVPVREHDLDIEAEAGAGLPGVLRLELLELLLRAQEGDHHPRHHLSPFPRRFSFSLIHAVAATK